ncbi:MAG: 4Fe-4S dicluster domain-containing protein [Candidatus Caldarchaeales archaeon]
MKKMTVEERLALTKIEIHSEPHIILELEKCKNCNLRLCISSCPAGLFTVDDSGEVKFTYEGCLECGACRILCPEGSIKWSYPPGGFGVQYRFG